MLRSAAFCLILLALSVAPSGLAHRTHGRRHGGRTGNHDERCKSARDSVGNATEICGSFTTSTIPSSSHSTLISATPSYAKSASTLSPSPAAFQTLVASQSPASSMAFPATTSSPDIGSDIDNVTPPSDIKAYLGDHNDFRALHGAAPLIWDNQLADKAQQWANHCQFVHSQGQLGPNGENLAAGTGLSYGINEAIKSWIDEWSDYDPNNPQPSHCTQVLWKSTQKIGCGYQYCDGIFPPEYGLAKFFVCEYQPQGNIINHFSENVQP